MPVSSKTTLAVIEAIYSFKATLDSRLWHGPVDAVGLPGHGVGDPADAVGHLVKTEFELIISKITFLCKYIVHLVKDYGLHAAHAGAVRHDPHDHPTSVLVLYLLQIQIFGLLLNPIP